MEGFIPMPEQSNVVPQNAVSTILLCKGVPWDANYSHVRLFGNKSELHSYIQSKAVKTIQSSTPVMFGDFTYSVDGNQEEIMRCNYMAFLNTPYTSEWKYAFVTGIEWLSVNSCRIKYSLDVWQNNIYDTTLNACYVEREHCYKSEDNLAYSLIPENFETGEMIIHDSVDLDMGNPLYVMLVSSTKDGEPPESSIYHDVYCGLGVEWTGDAEIFSNLVKSYVTAGMGDAIISIYQCPSAVAVGKDDVLTEYSQSIGVGTDFNDYVPKNKKMFQYPYNYCYIDTYTGKSAIIRFEYCDDHEAATIAYRGIGIPQPVLMLYPKYYKNLLRNYTESIILDSFVHCAWSNDAFQAFIAQQTPIYEGMVDRLNYNNRNMVDQQFMKTNQNILNTLVTLAGQNYGGAAIGAIDIPTQAWNTEIAYDASQYNLISTVQAQIASHDLIPPSGRGSTSGSYINFAMDLNRITMHRMGVTGKLAASIDDYWTMFGYPVHDVHVPRINTRSSWNFIKTCNCSISGDVMLQDLETLRKIFDNGVTIWHTNDVGNYALDNV